MPSSSKGGSFNIWKKAPVQGVRTLRQDENHRGKTSPHPDAPPSSGSRSSSGGEGGSGSSGKSSKQRREQEPEIEAETEEGKEEIKRLRREMEAEKEKVLEEARKAGEKAKKEAAQEGLKQGKEEGYRRGLEAAEKELKEKQEQAVWALDEAHRLLEEARRRYREIVHSSEETVVELSVAVAEKLLNRQLSLEPEAITDLVRQGLQDLPSGNGVKVLVNPEDAPFCLQHREELQQEAYPAGELEVVPRQEIPRGNCRVETEQGAVEIKLEEEKERLRQILRQEARQEQSQEEAVAHAANQETEKPSEEKTYSEEVPEEETPEEETESHEDRGPQDQQ